MKYKGYLKLFKQRTLPLSSLDNCKKKTKSPIKNTEPKTSK